jgi:hypothetical protein
MQPPALLQLAKSPPDVDPDEELELEELELEELELEELELEELELELLLLADPLQLAASTVMSSAFHEDSESVE